MSLVGSRVNLTHRCVIQRRASSGTDDWGGPESGDWQDHLTDVRCRVWASSGAELVANPPAIVPVEDVRVIVPLGTDVETSDRVASVTYRGGTAQDGPLGIRAKLTHRDHIELILYKVG